MADTVADLRPDGGSYSVSWFTTAVGAFDPPTDWSDNDDATWWEQQFSAGSADMSLADLALPALAVVKSLTVKVRASDPNNTGGAFFATALKTASAGQQATGNTPTLDSTIRTYTLGTLTSLNGKPLTGALVNALRLVIAAYDSSAPATQHHRIYEVYVTVAYNQAPAATVTGPSGTVADTDQPTITHTYSDPESDAQERVWRKVFESSVYSDPDFDPATSPAAWNSGPVLSSELGAQVGVALDNGSTYKAYAKVSDVGSSGRFGAWDAGPAFTISTDPPNVPVIIAPSGDTVHARVTMGVNAYENELTDNQATLTTDTAGWSAGVNSSIARTTDQTLNGPASLEITAVALGDVHANTSTGLVAVLPGEVWSAVASFRAKTAGKECRVDIRWRAADTTILSTSVGTHVMDDTAGWVEAFCVAEAPASAAFAEIILNVINVGANGVHYVDEIALRPSNDNLLSLNQASLEVDLTGWTAGINATLARSAAAALVHSGRYSLAVAAAAAGNMAARTTGLIAAKEGVAYTVGVWSRAVSVARNWNILVRFYDSAGSQIGVDADTTSPNVANLPGSWSQLVYALGASPAGTFFLSVHIQVAAAAGSGETHVFDDFTLSELSDTGAWAPGQTPWSRGGLTGRKIEMERSDDGGTTWSSARMSVGTATATPSAAPFTLNVPGQYRTVVVDHEAPPGRQVLYRARTVAAFAGDPLSGPWSYPMPATLTLDSAWLKDPLIPERNMPVDLQLPFEHARRNRSTVTDTLGAQYPIGRSDGRKGEAGKAAIDTVGEDEHDSLDLLAGSGATLLLQVPPIGQWYLDVVSDMANVLASADDSTTTFRTSTFDWVEVAAP